MKTTQYYMKNIPNGFFVDVLRICLKQKFINKNDETMVVEKISYKAILESWRKNSGLKVKWYIQENGLICLYNI